MRQLVIEFSHEHLDKVRKGEHLSVVLPDDAGGKWKTEFSAVRADGTDEVTGFVVHATELGKWLIRIEGYLVGESVHEDAGEAVREAFSAAGLHSLPEAVAVTATPEAGGEAWAVFTLDGQAHKAPLAQFSAEIEPSGRWGKARQARRPEIDALMADLKKLVRRS